jgi:hypothetical protein
MLRLANIVPEISEPKGARHRFLIARTGRYTGGSHLAQ